MNLKLILSIVLAEDSKNSELVLEYDENNPKKYFYRIQYNIYVYYMILFV